MPRRIWNDTAATFTQTGTYVYPGSVVYQVGTVLTVASKVDGNISSASASMTYLDTVATTGVSRSGFVQIIYGGIGSLSGTLSATANGGFTFAEGSVQVGTGTCDVVSCQGIGGLIPVTLGAGNQFVFNGWSQSSAITGYSSLPTYAESNNQIQVKFFEADGTTQATVIDVTPSPEPATWGMIAGGVAMLGLKARSARARG